MLQHTTNFDEHDDERPDTVPVNDVMVILVVVFSMLAAGAAAGTLRTTAVTKPGHGATSSVAPIAEIRIDRNGGISLSGRAVSRERLEALLRERMKAAQPDPMVLVETDDSLPSGESKSVRAFIQDLGCRPVER